MAPRREPGTGRADELPRAGHGATRQEIAGRGFPHQLECGIGESSVHDPGRQSEHADGLLEEARLLSDRLDENPVEVAPDEKQRNRREAPARTDVQQPEPPRPRRRKERESLERVEQVPRDERPPARLPFSKRG